MPETDLHQLNLGPLRAAAEAAELAQAASGLASAYGYRLADRDPLSPNTAIGGILRAFGYAITPSCSGSAWLVTGRRGQEREAGQ